MLRVTTLVSNMLLWMLLWKAIVGTSLVLGDDRFRKQQIDDRIQNTACEVGPDGHLYVLSMNYHGRTDGARLIRYLLDHQGRPLGEKEVVYQWSDDAKSQPIGLAFDPDTTAQQPVAWIALGESLQGHSGWSDPWAGRIYRVALPAVGSTDEPQFELKITNLPHAFHTVNNIRFGPDRRLYICCGSTTTLGWEPHTTEQLLSGAILRADVDAIHGTLDVKTADGGNYNPFAVDAPVTLFATAIRQAYDCTWHPNGRLYACTNQNDVNGQTGSGGGVPNVKNAKPPEFLAIIERGKTYGFPNATRGEFVLMGGNPTGADDGWTEIDHYPVGVKPPDSFDVSLLHRIDDIDGGSANGILSYRASGALRHRLICCFYNDDKIYTFQLGDNGRVTKRAPLLDLDGKQMEIEDPLDICQHPLSGHLYVAAYGHQDKGEEGAVYYLERQSSAHVAPFSIEPWALVGSMNTGAEWWQDTFSVTADSSEAGNGIRAYSDVDWLNVEHVGRSQASDFYTHLFQVRVAQSLGPGTHYATVQIMSGNGQQHGLIGIQIYVPSEDRQRWFAVSAGNSQDVTPGSLPVTLPLRGNVMTVRESDPVTVGWQVVSGPVQAVRIDDPTSARTTATFGQAGRYQLRLTAQQDGRSRQETATFIVDEQGNEPPEVTIQANHTNIPLGQAVHLNAHADDDGRPETTGQLFYRWSREGTGKGIVEFSQPADAHTSADFSQPGPYRIRCTVSDGVRQDYEDIVIRVAPRSE